MALSKKWTCLAALLVVFLALLVAEFLEEGEEGRLSPEEHAEGCPWGEPVVLRSEGLKMNLEAVGNAAVLSAPATHAGQRWTLHKVRDFVFLAAAGGRLQDRQGRLGVEANAEGTDGQWWVVPRGQETVRLQNFHAKYLAVNGHGQLQMTSKAKEWEDSWSILTLDGKPAFRSTCWAKRKAQPVLNDGWLAPHEQTPNVVPEPSELANYSWKPFYKVTEEDVRFYDEHGWVVLRQVVEPQVMDILRRDAEAYCAGQIAKRNVCQIEMLRWQLNTFRDFLFYGPIGSLVHAFVRGNGVRVSTEALFGTVFNAIDPPFFSYQYHTDAGGQFGVFHGFNTGTPAAAAWFPLHDVDAEVTGGGIKVVDGYPFSDCKWRNCGGMLIARGPNAPKEYNCPTDCPQRFGWRDCSSNGCKNSVGQRILSFKKGDIVIWHSDMPHATQSTKQVGFSRYAFTVRFVDSDAVMCDVAGSCGGWMACCKDTPLVSGQKIHSHCYPQLYPEVLEHEVNAHYSSTPKFLIADAATTKRISQTPPSQECWKPANAKDNY